MKKSSGILFIAYLFVFNCFSQIKKPPTSTGGVTAPIKSIPQKETSKEKTKGTKFTNADLKFEITFPETWKIADDEFLDKIGKQGFDLGLKAPDDLSNISKVRLNKALSHVSLLVTAYRPTFTTGESAIIRISSEDLNYLTEVRDAVDYFDLMRSQFKATNLPPDFSYSETQAEKLGNRQFAFIDTSNSAGKKRLYATVKYRYAILFAVSYKNESDLQTLRQILTEGNFALK